MRLLNTNVSGDWMDMVTVVGTMDRVARLLVGALAVGMGMIHNREGKTQNKNPMEVYNFLGRYQVLSKNCDQPFKK